MRRLLRNAARALVVVAVALGLARLLAHRADGAAAQDIAGATGRLLFTCDGAAWEMSPGAGGAPVQVVPRPSDGLNLTARWSPDGTRLVYAEYRVQAGQAPASTIALVTADGSNPRVVASGDEAPRRLTSLLFDDPAGAWAPDGSQIAMISAELLGVLPVDGGTPTRLLTPGAWGSVDWTR